MHAKHLARGLIALTLALTGCGDDSSQDSQPPEMSMDAGQPPGPRPDAAPPPPTWVKGMIEGDGFGLQPSLASSPDGKVGVAYFNSSSVMGEACTELGDEAVPDKLIWPIRFAEFSGGEWTTQTVHEPIYLGTPAGMQLAYSANAEPHVVAMTGEPLGMYRYCGANDVGVLTPGDDEWDLETVVVSSGEVMTGEAGSDFGEVVGYWPTIAFDQEGNFAVAYKDVHLGSIQGDDFTRADLEFAWKQGGGFLQSGIDIGVGAGDYNQLIFDHENKPVILYLNPVEQGIDESGLWIARSDDGEEWTRHRLYAGRTTEGPSIAMDPTDGTIYVAYYHLENRRPFLASLAVGADLETGWQQEALGDNRYDEGIHPSLAIDPNGHLALAWYRCNRVDDMSGSCEPQHDAVVFSWRIDGEWINEVVDSGGQGTCGVSPDLEFDGEGRAIVVYQCSRGSGEDFEFELDYARRRLLR